MTLTEPSQDRAAAASRWQAMRDAATAYGTATSDLRRSQRVEEVRHSETPRTPDRSPDRTINRVADERQRPSATAQLFDVTA